MPGLGDPLVREMRRLAAAHADWSGAPTTDPEELLARTTPTDEADRPGRLTRRDFLKTGAVLGAGRRRRIGARMASRVAGLRRGRPTS